MEVVSTVKVSFAKVTATLLDVLIGITSSIAFVIAIPLF
jgi:hypothetical protein